MIKEAIRRTEVAFENSGYWIHDHPKRVILITVWSTRKALTGIKLEGLDRDEVERLTIRIFQGMGLLFFIIIVAFPFIYMVITSLKSQMALLTNPTDLSISFESGLGGLIKSYQEVWTTFQFQRYIWISTVVSVEPSESPSVFLF